MVRFAFMDKYSIKSLFNMEVSKSLYNMEVSKSLYNMEVSKSLYNMEVQQELWFSYLFNTVIEAHKH